MARLHPSLYNKEFTYQDITLIPNRLPDFDRDSVDLSTNFTKHIILKTPIVASPMDTVCGAEMAILLALFGGIGVIHYNYSTIEEQIEEAKKVKKFEAGFVFDPVVLSPRAKVADVFSLSEKYGFFSFPITEDGTLNSKLVGIVTHRDVRYHQDMEAKLGKVMTPKEKLIVASKKDTVDKNDLKFANKILKKNNLDTLPIIDKEGRIAAIVTDSDMNKNEIYPLATKDDNKQLRVFIAVESRINLAKERIKQAVGAGVDGIIIDSSVVFCEQLEIAKWAKEYFPKLEIVIGNLVSGKIAMKIIKEVGKCCDALRVGIGPGAACVTQEEMGTGRIQASAVWECVRAVKNSSRIPIIADGGIRIIDDPTEDFLRPGDITKALALGAQTVMMGSILAGFDEAPGEKEFDYEENRMVKKYRGMGSFEAMEKRGGVRYGIEKEKIKVAEGKVIKVPYRGSGYDFLPRLIAGVKQSFQKQGFKNIKELQKFAEIKPLFLTKR